MKIIVTNIYFGMRPDYFDLYLVSCGMNPGFDFLFFVDFDISDDIPANVRFVKTTFQDLRNKFQSNFDFPIALNSPYKLCDYRPAYGVIFADYFDGYDWWGHCDFDMVYGDLSPVIAAADCGDYVKIFRRGHLSLYKNTAEINAVYKSELGPKRYREVFSTDKFCLFDETNGIDKTFTALELPVFREELIADINTKLPFLFMTAHANRWGQYFIWSRGKLYCKDQAGSVREFIYIHLQKRRMAEQYKLEEDLKHDILINQFGIFGRSTAASDLILKALSFIPNLAHVKRFYLPRIIKTLKLKMFGSVN